MNDIHPRDLERCQRGDAGALEAVFHTYGDRIYRLCLSLLGQPADAEDAAQEVLLRILDKARSFRGRSRFSSWVYRLTTNHCLNRRKSDRSPTRGPVLLSDLSEQELPPSPNPSPVETTSLAEQRDALNALLQQLSPEHRAVLVLRELEGLSYREIGEALEIPVGTVMSRLSRARGELARLTERPKIAAPRTASQGARR